MLESRWSKLFGVDRVRRTGGRVEADTGCGTLTALTPRQAQQRYASVGLPVSYTEKPHGIALQVRMRDLAATQRVLDANGTAYGGTDAGIAVTPESAGNTIIEFVQRA